MPANLRIAGTDDANEPEERLCEPLIAGQLGQEAIEHANRIHRAFLKSAGAALSELLQVSVPIASREAIQTPFSRVFSDIEPENYVIALDLAPLEGCGFLSFPKLLLFRILDILLATPETAFEETTRDESQRTVTGIELHILREFFEVFTNSLRQAWAPFYPVAFSQVSGEEKPELRAAGYGDNLALNLRTTVDLAGLTADIVLIVPVFLARLAVLAGAPVGQSVAPKPARGRVINCLSGATVRVDGVLQGASVRIRNLLDLLPDQILVLGNSEGWPVSCLVNSHPGFTGELTVSRGRYAIQVDAQADATVPRGAESQLTDASATDK